jgi:hypothetical protein
MTNLYYKIWIDYILRLRSQEKSKDDWDGRSLLLMSLAAACNLLLFTPMLQRYFLGYTFYEVNLSLYSAENNYMVFILLFLSPCFVFCVFVNYLLIFRKKRLKKLVRKYKYPYRDGSFAVSYIYISILLPIIPTIRLFIDLMTDPNTTFVWDWH